MDRSYKTVVTQGTEMELLFTPGWVDLIRSTALGSAPAIGSDNGTILTHGQHWQGQSDQRDTKEE